MAARPDPRFPFHPGVYEAQAKLKQGRVSRREFLRLATLLGTGAAAAYVLAACGAPTPAATAGPGGGTPKRGGTIRVGTQVQAIDHPARYSLIGFDANITRAVNEYLTETDKDNITHPYLLESWAASDDLKTWTLKLRQGIKWYQNGAETEELVADHVLFNFQQWLNPDIGSSIASRRLVVRVRPFLRRQTEHSPLLSPANRAKARRFGIDESSTTSTWQELSPFAFMRAFRFIWNSKS